MKACSVCGKTFHPNRAFQVFCSPKCREKNRTKIRKSPGHTKYQRSWSIKKSGRTPDLETGFEKRSCKNCKKEFLVTWGKKDYCSKRCQLLLYRQLNRTKIRVRHRKYTKADRLKHSKETKIRTLNYKKHRNLIFGFFGHNCVLCHNQATQVHHRKYSGDWKDCVPVCVVCHGIINGYQRKAKLEGVQT